MTRAISIIVAGLAGLAAVADAQTGSWTVTVLYGGGASSVNRANPVARVRVTAAFAGANFFAFGAGRFDMVATETGWVGAQAFPMLGGPNTPGAVVGGAVLDVRAGQIHFPPSIPANPANPIVVWEMDWTTTSFRPRSVGLSISTRRFTVYTRATSPTFRDLLPSTIPGGQGSIVVTPAPSGILALGIGAIVVGWRRR